MTTEDDFQAALDANPEDWQTRIAYAAWLQERGDPRAEGYRALGVNKLWGCESITRENVVEWMPYQEAVWFRRDGPGDDSHDDLPPDWFAALGNRERWFFWTKPWTNPYPNRRSAEDAAALAFAKLPAERRAELLAPNPERA
jgi:uncharacterized protein (TIGR02996 family)